MWTELILIGVSLALVFVSVLLHEANKELKRLQSEDRMQATLGELLDTLDKKSSR